LIRRKAMDTPKTTCQKPEELKGTPQECTPEQVKKCHGAEKDHPCVPGEKK
jgi:hypothetical protein